MAQKTISLGTANLTQLDEILATVNRLRVEKFGVTRVSVAKAAPSTKAALVDTRIDHYVRFVNKRQNARHIETIEKTKDVTLGGKYPGFEALVTYKDRSTEVRQFLYRGGFISGWKSQ